MPAVLEAAEVKSGVLVKKTDRQRFPRPESDVSVASKRVDGSEDLGACDSAGAEACYPAPALDLGRPPDDTTQPDPCDPPKRVMKRTSWKTSAAIKDCFSGTAPAT
jgi:hypothetical protein